LRILVTGASGFLGYHLVHHLVGEAQLPPHSIFGTWCSASVDLAPATGYRLDLRDADAVRSLLADLSPTHVVHTAAMSQTGDCERDPDAAYESNVAATANLVGACEGLAQKPHLCHISTDLVFDGTMGNYSEEDAPNPIQVYGTTKLAAEEQVRVYNGQWCILRSALIYGPATPNRSSFLQWMLQGLRAGNASLFCDEYRTPIFVDDLCAAIYCLCKQRQTGLFHCGGSERLSRWEFGCRVADAYGLEAPRGGLTRAAAGMESSRAGDVSLELTRLREATSLSPTPLAEALIKIRGR